MILSDFQQWKFLIALGYEVKAKGYSLLEITQEGIRGLFIFNTLTTAIFFCFEKIGALNISPWKYATGLPDFLKCEIRLPL
jgi:hypothetical protein